jgi:hypothetical protein
MSATTQMNAPQMRKNVRVIVVFNSVPAFRPPGNDLVAPGLSPQSGDGFLPAFMLGRMRFLQRNVMTQIMEGDEGNVTRQSTNEAAEEHNLSSSS